MNTSANPDNKGQQAACTPHSFFRGLYLLTKTFIWENLGVITALAALALLVVGPSVPAVQAYQFGINDFALVAIAAFVISASFAVLAYVNKYHRNSFSIAGLLALLLYMYCALLTGVYTQASLPPGADWWGASSILVKVAVAPFCAAMALLQIAVAVAAVAAVGWGLVKLPKALKVVTLYICRTGQSR